MTILLLAAMAALALAPLLMPDSSSVLWQSVSESAAPRWSMASGRPWLGFLLFGFAVVFLVY